MNNIIKTVVGVIILIALFGIAMKLLGWLINVLLPLAIVVIAAYLVYRFVSGRKL